MAPPRPPSAVRPFPPPTRRVLPCGPRTCALMRRAARVLRCAPAGSTACPSPFVWNAPLSCAACTTYPTPAPPPPSDSPPAWRPRRLRRRFRVPNPRRAAKRSSRRRAASPSSTTPTMRTPIPCARRFPRSPRSMSPERASRCSATWASSARSRRSFTRKWAPSPRNAVLIASCASGSLPRALRPARKRPACRLIASRWSPTAPPPLWTFANTSPPAARCS